jgi:flagellar motor component MotA
MTNQEFNAAYAKIGGKAMSTSKKSLVDGLLSLEEDNDSDLVRARDIFELGVRLVVDGTARDFIDRVLSNIIEQEKDLLTRRLKNIQKEAVLGIQEGLNPRRLVILLNSLTGLSYNEDPVLKAMEDESHSSDDDVLSLD